jgi:hypothetical protein
MNQVNQINETNQTDQIDPIDQMDHTRNGKGPQVSTACAGREEVLSAERDAWYKRPGFG